jgi:cellulose synthase/poly-beta-1,6-N-acetylglucosamine synthase-like glycosyltransferase/exo-beta-1,3-glucanase (GH17 family)
MRFAASVVVLAVCVHAGLWAMLREETTAPNVDGQLASVSYAPYASSGNPEAGYRPTPVQIRADLKAIAPVTRAIRTYSSTAGGELVPGIADEFGLKVTQGIWLSGTKLDQELARARSGQPLSASDTARRNEVELRTALDLARKYRNINSIVVGNETIYRGETVLSGDDQLLPEEIQKIERVQSADELKRAREDVNVTRLIRVIQKVKRETQLPVTTGEIWSVWRDHPELVSAVDYIAVHILPYWEGIPDKGAVDQAIAKYDELRRMYPGKRIVIAEFGWPSAGYNRRDADPGRQMQAAVMRDFVVRAEALGIDYNVIEAMDQPWKTFEGSVGPYWGLFDASRQPKFAWSGPLTNPDYGKIAGLAILFGFLVSLPVLRLRAATLSEAALLTISAHAVGAWFAAVFAYWNGHYFVFGAAFALALGVALLVPLVFIALSRLEEIAAIAFGSKRRCLLAPAIAATGAEAPKVSIHIPAYREPPEMLKATLDAVAALDYPNFECVIVINNTPDPAFWQPVADHCQALGSRFKFVHADKLEGFKAGALRLALTHTAEDAAIVGIIDADYVVHPDWLKDLVPGFADPTVGLIQAPQDHRDGDRSVLHHALNAEYAGFFDIGMVERNEANAIIVHGTMCLIRRTALEAAGSWSSDTIVEDTDLGLTILELGWRAHYTNRRYGHGLLPDTYDAFKKQRHRWAYGGVQILRKHWRRFLPGTSLLTAEQRREYAIGWLNWLGAESFGVAVALLNLLWVPVVAFLGIAVPDKILTIPIIATFLLSLIHFVALYRLRVAIPPRQMIAAIFAAMSVQWTVARAVSDGMIKDHLPFTRTAKGGATRKGNEFPAFWEAVIGGLLILGAVVLVATNWEQVREINIFALVLVVQSLPFLAAAGIATLERSRANEFAFWKVLEGRLAEFLPRRAAVTTAPAPAEKRIETAP